MAKSKVLIVGGTGYIGKHIVKASLAQGHETYVLQRRELNHLHAEKVQMLLSFKKQGARLVEASFSDHQSLVDAVKLVDVVICTIAGASFKNPQLLLQLKLVNAIKEAGNVKRFLPSEFGLDPAKMGHAPSPGRKIFDDKLTVRKAIEDAKIPFTYVSSNLFAGYFVGGLGGLGKLTPPNDKVFMYGDGNVKVVFMDEEDIATYTLKTIDDPRTLNKTVYIKPQENVISQRILVDMYEKFTGKTLEKISIPGKDFLASVKDKDYVMTVGVQHYYSFFYEGCTAHFEVGDDEEASKLYPEVQYTRMDEYLKRFC